MMIQTKFDVGEKIYAIYRVADHWVACEEYGFTCYEINFCLALPPGTSIRRPCIFYRDHPANRNCEVPESDAFASLRQATAECKRRNAMPMRATEQLGRKPRSL